MAQAQQSLPDEIALRLSGLRKSFGEKKVLRGLDLDLRWGEILALFGGSGSGKSVILRSIIGLERLDEGMVLFQSGKGGPEPTPIDITDLDERELVSVRREIAYVFQNGALFDSLTVEENLAYPLVEHTGLSREEIRCRVDEMLALVDLKGSNGLLPAELSGGMQKRAGLARAIILEPRVILFDEPTAGLDPINTQRLIANIRRLKERGITGIFVTHDIPSAYEIADRVAFLYNGVIYAIDTVDKIRASSDPTIRAFIAGVHPEASR